MRMDGEIKIAETADRLTARWFSLGWPRPLRLLAFLVVVTGILYVVARWGDPDEDVWFYGMAVAICIAVIPTFMRSGCLEVTAQSIRRASSGRRFLVRWTKLVESPRIAAIVCDGKRVDARLHTGETVTLANFGSLGHAYEARMRIAQYLGLEARPVLSPEQQWPGVRWDHGR